MPSWPASLPQEFEQDGFRSALPNRTDRSDVRSGVRGSRQRPRRDVAGPIRGRMILTTTQWETLTDFYENDLSDGALSFDFPDPDDASGTIVVAFAATPALSTIGGATHHVRLSFERQN